MLRKLLTKAEVKDAFKAICDRQFPEGWVLTRDARDPNASFVVRSVDDVVPVDDDAA